MKVHDGGSAGLEPRVHRQQPSGCTGTSGSTASPIFLVLLTALLFPLTIILGATARTRGPTSPGSSRWRQPVMGSFLSLDLIVFFFMFELTLVPAYFIIAGWGHQRRAYAAIKSSSTPSSAQPSCSSASWRWPSSTSRSTTT